MIDREKVIKGLESLRGICIAKSDMAIGEGRTAWAGYASVVHLALDLLREQEPVKPKTSEWLEDSDPGQEYGTTWACAECGCSIHEHTVWNPYRAGFKYCPFCGYRMVLKRDD